jgi:hypothetical protein
MTVWVGLRRSGRIVESHYVCALRSFDFAQDRLRASGFGFVAGLI